MLVYGAGRDRINECFERITVPVKHPCVDQRRIGDRFVKYLLETV